MNGIRKRWVGVGDGFFTPRKESPKSRKVTRGIDLDEMTATCIFYLPKFTWNIIQAFLRSRGFSLWHLRFGKKKWTNKGLKVVLPLERGLRVVEYLQEHADEIVFDKFRTKKLRNLHERIKLAAENYEVGLNLDHWNPRI